MPATFSYSAKAHFLARLQGRLSRDQLKLVERAYCLANAGHQGQLRDDGTPYFSHPEAVAYILIGLGMYDHEVIIAALLHDTAEDTWLITYTGLYSILFGSWTARAIFMVTKRPESDYHRQLATADWRMLFVKLADRLHNVRTLGACTEAKRSRKLRETHEHYLPLAEQLVAQAPAAFQSQARHLRDLLVEALELELAAA